MPEKLDRTRAATPRVLVVDPLHHHAMARLAERYALTVRMRPDPDELARLLSATEVVVLRSGVRLTAAMLRDAPSLKVIARAGSGVDNIDLPAAIAAGITVFNIPAQTAPSVAEFTFALLLALARRIGEADRQVRKNVWQKTALVGIELAGKRLALIGVGEIGKRVGLLAGAFGMQVAGCVARPGTQRRAELATAGIALMDLDALLRWADMVTIQVPLTPATADLIGARELALLRPGALLVNVSRGEVVNEAALLTALIDGRLAGAALDVHSQEFSDSPFAALDNTLLTPHIGAMTDDGQLRVATRLLEGIDAALNGGVVANRIS